MENTDVSWKDTVDPDGCRWGPEHYKEHSRDPERTPMQWDNTTFAGKFFHLFLSLCKAFYATSVFSVVLPFLCLPLLKRHSWVESLLAPSRFIRVCGWSYWILVLTIALGFVTATYLAVFWRYPDLLSPDSMVSVSCWKWSCGERWFFTVYHILSSLLTLQCRRLRQYWLVSWPVQGFPDRILYHTFPNCR